MLLLPRTVGSITLLRKLGAGGIAESYLGRTESGAGRAVVVRRVLPFICAEPGRLAGTEARVRDLIGIRHPFLVPVLEWVADGSERFIVEERVEGVDLASLVAHRRSQGRPLPANVFLNVATQICNGLEALHGRPGQSTGLQQVLHLGLRPGAVRLTPEGKVVLGSFGLVRSPTMLPHGGVSAPAPGQLRYLAPEQTLSDAEMTPASDIFSLGAILYELATNEVLFDTDSNLRTIHAVRRAEVEAKLERVRDVVPGLDRVLTRALARNPRFRYHRAFVLREDLRGLMAGYNFGDIAADTQAVLQPLLRNRGNEHVLAQAPEPSLSAGQAHTLHAGSPLHAGLFEDTRQGSPPPLVTEDSVQVHARPTLPDPAPPVRSTAPPVRSTAPPVRSTAPPVAKPPPDLPPPPPSVDSLPPLAESMPNPWPDAVPVSGPPPVRPTFRDRTIPDPPKRPGLHADLPLEPDYTLEPEPESEFGDVPLPYDSLLNAEAGSPEELPSARSIPARQQSWAVARRDTADGTVGFLANEPLPSEADLPDGLMPPPPLAKPPPDLDPNATSFIPAPPPVGSVPLPPSAADLPLPPPLPAPPVPARAAPASPEATGLHSFPLPPAPSPESLPPPPALPALAAPAIGAPPPAPPVVEAPAPPPVAPSAPSRLASAPPPAARPARQPPSPSGPVYVPHPPPFDGDAPEKASGNTLLLAGVGLAAMALVVCTGVAGVAFLGTGDGASPQGTDAVAAVDPTVTPDTPSAEEPEEGGGSAEALEGAGDEPEPPPSRPAPAASARRTGGDAAPAARSSSPRRTAARSAPPPRLPPKPLPLPARVEREETAPADAGERAPVDLERASRTAKGGGLDAETRRRLEDTAIDDPDFTRAYTILAADAQARGDTAAAERYLEQLMALAENRYNPVLLSELARLQVNRRRYSSALRNANTAEQHWARIPSSVMFERKAEIYEVQAAATQGLLYESESEEEQLELLDDALKRWTRYREHADAGSRTDLVARADTQIDKLRAIRSRLE